MRYTAPAATSAPANAKAVRPTASRSVRPRPKLCPITTPNAAPAEMPSTEGSASGFRERAAGEHGGGDPRQADRQGHHPLDRIGCRSPHKRRYDRARRELSAAEKERGGRGEDQHS